MNRLVYPVLLIIPLVIFSCSNKTDLAATYDSVPVIEETIQLDPIVVQPDTRSYRASETRINDLIHTKLDVSFDWKNRWVIGTAIMDFSPYFYPTSELVLDAKGMVIKRVDLISQNGQTALEYEYDNSFIRISLDKEYTRSEDFKIQVEYIAKPENIEQEGSSAIGMANGLYFINPDSTEVKPTQIWTQGETESSSCWFPTIDSPNERMTQEIAITVDSRYKTLSNGELIFQNHNSDGTRTDYWQQMIPHAPYLVMLSVGDYSVVADNWMRGEEEILVDYYVEKEYEPYARDIFGNTPEMLSFYSEILGYPYPWDKYSQVVVRDFVSGAMENTSAVIHGEFLNATERELLDGNNEAIIAHELFHHWFGDLVTCESWSNLPLNESFATYGEYLWMEHKYGREEADLHGHNSQAGYLAESRTKEEDLIRFFYDDKEDMFDGHSYNKGGRVLHMLRYFLGDDAFFAGLNLYLNDNKFEAVEIHQLRLAMEEVSGKDLNWFFNQWFLGSGHPNLEINYMVQDSLGQLIIQVEQKQDRLFRLPLYVDIFSESGENRQRIDIRKRNQEFLIPISSDFLFANVDADKVLLGTKEDNRPEHWWAIQYDNAKVFLDKHEAISKCLKLKDETSQAAVYKALKDDFWNIRQLALGGVDKIKDAYPDLEGQLISMVQSDPKTGVQAKALKIISKRYKDTDHTALFNDALNSRSYRVMSAGLSALTDFNPEAGIQKAEELQEENPQINGTLADIFAEHGSERHDSFFTSAISQSSGYETYVLLGKYSEFITRQSPTVMERSMSVFSDNAQNASVWWVRLAGFNGLKGMKSECEEKAEGNSEYAALGDKISTKINELLETEENDQIIRIMNSN